jgi:hypothetical protein
LAGLAAPSTDYTIEFQITGHVNDEAVMTHFDMEGVVSEKIVGYERAARMELIQGKPDFKDGSASVIYHFDNNTPPNGSSDAKLGKVRSQLFNIQTVEHAQRVAKFVDWALFGIMIDLTMLMRTSISSWRNGECVDVDCSAPKTTLKPNEQIDVTVVSVSRHDRGKFNAKLKALGTESVTPENQDGTPQAVYRLTGPTKGEGNIIVTSTSKRGIGSGMLTFTGQKPPTKPPVKAPPVKTPPCDGGWTGTVKAVRSERVDKEKKADGRLVREINVKRETFDVKLTVLGTRDLTAGILNRYHANAEAGFLGTDYNEANYEPGKMLCDHVMITTPQTRKIDRQQKGEANGGTLIAISVIGNRGYFEFTPPSVLAEQITTRAYESGCAPYNAANSSTEKGDQTIEIVRGGFELEFEVDPSSPNVLKGSKTVQNSDGSETTYTWDLSRCR